LRALDEVCRMGIAALEALAKLGKSGTAAILVDEDGAVISLSVDGGAA